MKKKNQSPPAFSNLLLRLFLDRDEYNEKSGDLEEVYYTLAGETGVFKAGFWYRYQIFKAVPVFVFLNLLWSFIMFRNYLKITFRNLFNQKGYSVINILGLATGMACTILILLWVQDELNHDRFHKNINNIYCVPTWVFHGSEKDFYSGSPPALAPALKRDYPEIVNSTRILSGSNNMLVRYGKAVYYEKIRMADPSIFEMFTFPFIAGSLENFSSGINSIVLTESLAKKYFGEKDPTGEVLTLENRYEFKIAGVIKNIPHNSIIKFDILLPLEFSKKLRHENYTSTWSNYSFKTYIQLTENADHKKVHEKIRNIIKKNNAGDTAEPDLFPFGKRYLYEWGNIREVRMFSMIAVSILLIACINFMNLTTARSAKRAREVGLRKVAGARRKQLILQFFGESVTMTAVAFIFALLLVYMFLPAFSTITGKSFSLSPSGNFTGLMFVVCIALFAGLLSGSYPAFFLSSFQPAKVLKGSFVSGRAGSMLRKTLVVAQFAMSIILIIATTIVYNQIQYMKNKDLGFKREHLIHIPAKGELARNYEVIKNELRSDPGILNAAMCSRLPTGIYHNGSGWEWEGKHPDLNPLVTYLSVDADYLETFGMEMVFGSFFTRDITPQNLIINEKFAEIMKMKNPVGKQMRLGEGSYTVTGVIRNFHFKSMDMEIEPIVLTNNPEGIAYKYMFLKISGENIPETIGFLEKTINKHNPQFPFEYRFLDDDFDRLYISEKRTGIIVRYFAVFAVFISCLGLFGLSSFMAEQRTKEIGVRKVLGASVSGIILLLSKEFVKWILLANILAWPVSYYFMNNWLNDYAYRISIGYGIFIYSGFLALTIAVLTVIFQAIKAAYANPVDALKYE